MIYGTGLVLDWEQLPNEEPTPPSTARKYWRGLCHQDLARELIEEFKNKGVSVKGNRFALSRNNLNMVGVLYPNHNWTGDHRPTLALTNYNDGTRSLQFFAGADMLGEEVQCGICFGRVLAPVKHTTNLHSRNLAREVVDQWLHLHTKMGKRVLGKLSRQKLDRLEAWDLLLKASKEGQMPWSRLLKISKVLDEQAWGDPEQPNLKITGLDLYKGYAEVVKQNQQLLQVDQLDYFRRLVLGEKPLTARERQPSVI